MFYKNRRASEYTIAGDTSTYNKDVKVQQNSTIIFTIYMLHVLLLEWLVQQVRDGWSKQYVKT
jgi:hypothetical protein